MLRCVQAVFACALPHYPPASVGSGPTSFEVYGLDFMVDDEGKVCPARLDSRAFDGLRWASMTFDGLAPEDS